jgi:uncharacterized protein YjaG (DUF416 family)
MKLDINNLTMWQQQVFASALLQRMLPNYAYFSKATKFGDSQLIQNQMDIIWQKLSLMPITFNAEVQLDKLQQNIPNENDFDMFAVYPAIDVCSGLVSLLESFDEKETRCGADLSLLSINSVHAYLMLQSQQQEDEYLTPDIENDPLHVWELQTQQEVYDILSGAKPSKALCQKVKSLVMQERLTNLAIEY